MPSVIKMKRCTIAMGLPNGCFRSLHSSFKLTSLQRSFIRLFIACTSRFLTAFKADIACCYQINNSLKSWAKSSGKKELPFMLRKVVNLNPGQISKLVKQVVWTP